MAWEVDDKKALKNIDPGLSETALMNYNSWVNNIRNGGLHPKEAAEAIGDANYKRMKGTSKNVQQFEIRLNGSDRVSFILDKDTVYVLQIGGHS
ncbi:hypothetical protein HZS38_08770 [Xenorhabdus nematophila]|uniref:Uncharacterized protein n=1 Tax=Xenorhabdus nematophila (strain ATCC 19061 / DSM 3370 / CCUG 14189 / LMG 1036 / NCIMB 9965 / AN6) TaxID=406817 RepID=D3VDU5_XENNA|nr:hypothetical protein [Xenorhabdus nematophila]CEE94048.1 hypothetical protein XNA1_4470044 [Xenorhabdus nematophila str. Anatoliense]CEF32424.1 hypothetical protein XNW1_4330009 [Xenorhabdus nematophila str. Websteri]AYA40499.1 hypothetical protein D3790_08620 [Xenorhabdus nematophila]KHD27784.1 hypothetical protein LH67_15200 [Xenorhabdus nematophila]MBA0019236.1 hypothetical protein [Xenorhabdus nematophila]